MLISYEANAFLTYRFATGAQQTVYKEFHSNQPSKNTDTEVNLVSNDFSASLNLFRKFLMADARVSYGGPVLSSSTVDEVTFLNYEGRLLMSLNAKPFMITLTAEYFSDAMTASDTSFGYKTMSGSRFGVIFNSPIPILGFDFSFYYPYWVQIVGRQEFGATLTWKSRRSEEGDAPTEGSGKGFFIEFGYNQKNVMFEELIRPIEIRTTTLSGKLGVYF